MKIKLNVTKLIDLFCDEHMSVELKTKICQLVGKYGEHTAIEAIAIDKLNPEYKVHIPEIELNLMAGEYTIVDEVPVSGKEISIVITGPIASGKTAIMEYIAQQCHAIGIKTTIDYGSDGDPRRTPDRKLKALSTIVERGVKVRLEEKYTCRRGY